MYKEFCYLVSSLKNHCLMYHFLNLLNHQNQKSDEVNFLIKFLVEYDELFAKSAFLLNSDIFSEIYVRVQRSRRSLSWWISSLLPADYSITLRISVSSISEN